LSYQYELTDFCETRENQKNRSVFDTKFNFWNLAEKPKTKHFLENWAVFCLSIGFQPIFCSKFNFWMENGKPTGFPVYCLVFPVYRSVFQKKSKVDFFKSNQPVFGESKKPDQTGFVRFL
jgi:hypothetical protein